MSQNPSELPYYKSEEDFSKLYLERVEDVAKAAKVWRSRFPCCIDGKPPLNIAVLGIDCQNAFCLPGASLFVPGANDDMRRAAEWIYRNVGKIGKIYLSLDSHTVNQVFHPNFWEDERGKQPEPFTVITASQVRDGIWKPRINQNTFIDLRAATIDYCDQLEKSGKYALTIWPYHAMLGGASHGILPGLMEACLFHSMAKATDVEFILKGRSQFTENYSIFAPEVYSLSDGVVGAGRGIGVGHFNNDLTDALKRFDRVYVFGEASSHCVMSSLYSLITTRNGEPMEDRNYHLNKIYILEDAMSPVPPPPLNPLPDALNFPMVAKKALADFANVGMHIVKTTDAIEV